jgi:excisionase family DNA binding protein
MGVAHVRGDAQCVAGVAEATTLKRSTTAENAEARQIPALLTVQQAMRELGGISRQTLYALIGNRRLRSVRIGSRRLIPADAITECIAQLPKD